MSNNTIPESDVNFKQIFAESFTDKALSQIDPQFFSDLSVIGVSLDLESERFTPVQRILIKEQWQDFLALVDTSYAQLQKNEAA